MTLALVPKPAVDGLPKLNLGCGRNPKEGFVNVDMTPGNGVDVTHDLMKTPWPWADGSIGAIECTHVLEHLPLVNVEYKGRQIDALVAVMNEAWRVLAPGGRLVIEVPTVHGQGAFQDPTHRRFFVENTIYYFGRRPSSVPGTPDYDEFNFQRYLNKNRISFTVYARMTLKDKNKTRDDAEEWVKTDEGKPDPWKWDWYGEDSGIESRFDVLRVEFDGPTAFMSFYLQKPEV